MDDVLVTAPAPVEAPAPATRRPRALLVTALVAAATAAYTLLPQVRPFVERAFSPHPMTPYVVRQYWLSYDHGFVRRALPGAVLHLLSGGAEPGYRLVRLAGAGLAVAAVVAVGVLAVVLARRASGWPARIGVAALVVGTPLTAPLYVQDVGRTDAVGVVVLVALACLPWRRLPVGVVVAAVALLTAVAAATEEFLVLLVVPVAALALHRRLPSSPRRRLVLLGTLVPAGVVAVLSAVLPAPRATVDEALAAADAAGAPPPVPVVVDHDSVSRLRHGFVDNLVTYYRLTDPLTDVLVTLLWAAVFALTVGLVWHLLGGSPRRRAFAVAVGWSTAAALLLSVSGIDYRRWWALAAVGALATLALCRPGRGRVAVPGWRAVVAVVVLAGLSAWMYAWPLFVADLFA